MDHANENLSTRVRWTLAVMVIGITVVFAIAFWLKPYGKEGQPLLMGTHEQLGFPKCNFLVLTGYPCPSCGMTTSFALLARGDVLNSLKANAVGTALAAFSLAFLPWACVCLIRGKLLLIRRLEFTLAIVMAVFITLALGRWAWILAPRF